MDIFFYENLQTAFIYIRRLSTEGCYDEVLFNKTIENIKLARATLSAQNQTTESTILLYCIDTLLEIAGENNREKLCNFADTIHNMPEIAVAKRTFKSFRLEIKAFRKKYGKAYFADFNKLLKKRIITPLSVGIFYIISPVPILMFDFIFSWIMFFDIGWTLFGGHENIPFWYDTLTILPVLIFPLLPISGIIYGIVKRKEKHGKLCIVLSSIGFLINALIFAFMMYLGTVA